MVAQFAAGARMLRDAGFDAVELHLGTTTCLVVLDRGGISDATSTAGRWDRARLACAFCERSAMRSPGRWRSPQVTWSTASRRARDRREHRFARIFEHVGVLDAIELTAGGSRANQNVHVPGDAPRKEFEEVLPSSQRLAFRALAPVLFRRYPFERAYFLPMARRFRQQLSLPVILLVASTPSRPSTRPWRRGSVSWRWQGCSRARPHRQDA